MATDIEDALYEAYQGEVLGQAFFETLAESAPNPTARQKWQTLARLEAATKDRLRPCVVGMGRAPTPDPNRIEQGEAAAASYEGMDWETQVRSMQPVLVRAIASFEESEQRAGDAYREVAAALTAHERALLTFTERELAGEPDSLAEVEALLA